MTHKKKFTIIFMLTLLGTAFMIFYFHLNKRKFHLNTVQKEMDHRVRLGYNTAISAAYIDDSGTHFLNSGNGIDEYTPFEIASISKAFTAHLAVILHREKKVNLFKNIKVLDLPITIYDLLTHSSGIVDPDSSEYFNPTTGNTTPIADYTAEEAIHYCQKTGLSYPTGTKLEYSNLGYSIVALELAKATGETFENLLKKKIFFPLKMYKTGFHIPPIQGTRHGIEAPPWEIKELRGFAGLVSCSSDLARYLQYLFLAQENDDLSKDKKLLLSLFQKVKHPNPNIKIALGWILNNAFKGQTFEQTGRSLGFSCYVGYSQKQKSAAVLLTNAHSLDNLGQYILNELSPLIKIKKSLPIKQHTLKKYQGKYYLEEEEGKRIYSQVSCFDSKYISITIENDLPIILFPKKKNVFYLKSFENHNEFVFFKENEKGNIVCFEVVKNGKIDFTFKKM